MKLDIKVNFIFLILLILLVIHVFTEEKVNFEKNTIETEIIERNNKKYPLSTQISNANNGDILSLTNHRINCSGNSVLNGFHLWGKSGINSNNVAVEYRCLQNKKYQKKKKKRTTNGRMYKDHRDAADKLGYLSVSCPLGSLINSFRLKSRKTSIYYEYYCAKAAIKKCKIRMTPSAYLNTRNSLKKSINRLDQFHIKAKKGFGLQMFRGENFGQSFRYVFLECELA